MNPRHQYYISYERDDGGGYVASVPAIPGCVVYGKTLKLAHKNATSAIKECLEVIRAKCLFPKNNWNAKLL